MNIKFIIFILLASVTLFSCNSKKDSANDKPFSGIDFSKGEYKLFFYVPPGDPNAFDYSGFQKEYKNFYITDKEALTKIKESLITEKASSYNFSGSLYIVSLTQDNEIIDGGFIDIEDHIFLSDNGEFHIDSTVLSSLSNYFIPLLSYEVTCKTISISNMLFDFIENSKGFNYTYNDERKNPLLDYTGYVELFTIKENFDVDKLQKQIEKDFKGVGKTQVIGLSYNGKDSLSVEMLWENNFSKNLPDGYKIIKSFTDSIDLPLPVYNVEKSQIIEFFSEEDITEYEIKEMYE